MKKNIYYEDNLINKVGIDRILFNKVVVKSIDIKKFKSVLSTTDVRYDDSITAGRNYYMTENGVKFHYLKIIDKNLGTMKFGVKNQSYGKYQFSPKEMYDGVNVVNCSSEDIHAHIKTVVEKVEEKYGIVLDFEFAQILEVELNTTFELRHKFSAYRRPIALMMSLMPYLKKDDTYVLNNKQVRKKEITGETVHNNELSITIYNKRLEMELKIKNATNLIIYDEHGEVVEGDLIRIEIKLKTPETVSKKFFDKKKLSDLSSQLVCQVFEKIADYYFFQPYSKWKKNNDKMLKNLVKKEMRNGHRWKIGILEEMRNLEMNSSIPFLLEVEDLYEAIKEISSRNRNRARLIKGFKFREKDVFLSKDGEKYLEILDTLKWIINETKATIK